MARLEGAHERQITRLRVAENPDVAGGVYADPLHPFITASAYEARPFKNAVSGNASDDAVAAAAAIGGLKTIRSRQGLEGGCSSHPYVTVLSNGEASVGIGIFTCGSIQIHGPFHGSRSGHLCHESGIVSVAGVNDVLACTGAGETVRRPADKYQTAGDVQCQSNTAVRSCSADIHGPLNRTGRRDLHKKAVMTLAVVYCVESRGQIGSVGFTDGPDIAITVNDDIPDVYGEGWINLEYPSELAFGSDFGNIAVI